MTTQEEEARIAAAVAKELEKIAVSQQKQFAKTLDMAMKNALKGIDQTNAMLQKERKAVEKQLDAAEKLRSKYEREAEKMAYDYFTAHRKALGEAAQTELLRNLTRMHIEVGKSTRDIAVWLDVPQDFVENIRRIVKSTEQYRPHIFRRTPVEGNPKIRYSNQGRGGTLHFESRETSFDLWWEYAGGNALAIIEIPTAEKWVAATQLPLEKRMDFLNFIGEQVVLDQTAGAGSFIIGENAITIFPRVEDDF